MTTAAGVKVAEQFPVFGIAGALVVAVLQSVLINHLVSAIESNRELPNSG